MHPNMEGCLALGRWTVDYEVQRPPPPGSPAGTPKVVGVVRRWVYTATALGDHVELVLAPEEAGEQSFRIILDGALGTLIEAEHRQAGGSTRIVNPVPGSGYLHPVQEMPALLDFPALPVSWAADARTVACAGFEKVSQKIALHPRKGWVVRMFGAWKGTPFTVSQEYPVAADGSVAPVWSRAQKLHVRHYPIVQGKRRA